MVVKNFNGMSKNRVELVIKSSIKLFMLLDDVLWVVYVVIDCDGVVWRELFFVFFRGCFCNNNIICGVRWGYLFWVELWWIRFCENSWIFYGVVEFGKV